MIKWSLYESCVQEGDGEGCFRGGGGRTANRQVCKYNSRWSEERTQSCIGSFFRSRLLKETVPCSFPDHKKQSFPIMVSKLLARRSVDLHQLKKIETRASKRLLRYCSVYLGLRFTGLQDHYLLFYYPLFTSDDLEEDTHQEQWLWDVPWGPFRTKCGIPASLRASCLFPTSL